MNCADKLGKAELGRGGLGTAEGWTEAAAC